MIVDARRGTSRIDGACAVTAVVAAIAFALGLHAILPLVPGFALCAVVIFFVAPGVLAAWMVFAPGPGRSFGAWCIGPIWGYGLSSLVLLGLWAAGLRREGLLVAPLLAVVPALALGWLARGTVAPRQFRRADVVAVLVLIALVPALVGRPFARVGETLPEGRAYRAYFTADFVWRMAVVAELSKGDFPPRNPFYRGDRMHYYWLAHLLPAAEYEALQKDVRIEKVLLTHSMMLGLAFTVFLFYFVRRWVDSTAAAVAACLIAFLGSSFEGLERVIHLWRTGAPYAVLTTLNIDAVTRWFYGSLPVDGLQRLVWYQPHHSTGYALGLSALLVAAEARDALSVRVMTLCGVLLALCLLLSSFAAIMLTDMVCVVALIRALRERDWRRLPTAALAGALPLVAATWLAFELRYVDRSGSSLFRFLVNPLAMTNTTQTLVLSFGPLLIGAVAGAIVAIRRRAIEFVPIAVIVLVSFLFYFFVDLRDHQFVYVGWRAGHFLFVAFAVLTGYALTALRGQSRRVRTFGLTAAVLVTLLSVPTFAIDFYNTQDTSNRREGPGFPWTLILTPDETAMFDWVKSYTPQDAVVQIEPFSRESTWAYVPAFVERRMSAGLPISMVPLGKYQEASERVREIYRTRDPEAAYERAARLGIDYLVVGGPERHAYPGFEDMLRSNPARFHEVFRRPGVSVFLVQGAR